MPRSLVRMTVNICLFTTLIASNLIVMNVASACSISNVVPIRFQELNEIPGWTKNPKRSLKWKIIGQTNCELFHSWTPGEVQRSIGTTCPFESLASQGAKSELFNHEIWSNIGRIGRQRETELTAVYTTTFNWTTQIAHEFRRSCYQSTLEGIDALLSQAGQHLLASTTDFLPGVFGATGESPNAITVIDSGNKIPATKSKIQLSGKQKDSYWQYYDDCDRWGVEFTTLLGAAQTFNKSVNSLQVRSVAVETDPVENAIFANTSTWIAKLQLYRQQISARMSQWLRIAEFSTVESSGIEPGLFPGVQLKRPTDTSRVNAWTTSANDWVNHTLANQIDRVSMGLSQFANRIRPNSEQNYQASRRPVVKGSSTQTQ